MKIKSNNQWYARKPFIILLLIFFLPLGIFMMWKYANYWSSNKKWAATGILSVFWVIMGIIGYNSPPTIVIDDLKEDKINTDSAEYLIKGRVSSPREAVLTINNENVATEKNKGFQYKVTLKEGYNTFNIIALNSKGEYRQDINIYRTTQAELVKKEEYKKTAESKEKSDQEINNKSSANRKTFSFKLPIFKWPFSKSEKEKRAEQIEKDRIAKEKAEAELRKPLYKFEDFYKWATTVDYSANLARWSYIISICDLYTDQDNDGDKDIYFDKNCLQENYKDYIKLSAFDYGTGGSEWLCPKGDEKYYTYLCSKFGDMLQLLRVEQANYSLVRGKDYKDAELLYNQIARTKDDTN